MRTKTKAKGKKPVAKKEQPAEKPSADEAASDTVVAVKTTGAKKKAKELCAGSQTEPVEVRQYGQGHLAKCGSCGRVLKLRANGKLGQHGVRSKTTASHDSTMEILWGRHTPEPRTHFALGLPIKIRQGAVPAGWKDDDFADYWYEEDYERTFTIKDVGSDGTFEVMGWFWEPTDLTIPYA